MNGPAGLLHLQIDVDLLDSVIEKRIREGQYLPPSGACQLLTPIASISDVWPGRPPNKHLHVFVSQPAVGSPAIVDMGGEPFIRLVDQAQDI